ncbi:hypothetical protein FSJ84_020440 [Escherichia coli]|nr:hypothetical protein [Escherichia coli]
MTRKEYIKELAREIIQTNQPVIDRIVQREVDKIKAQLASLATNMADCRKMLAVMGSNSALATYLAKTDELAGFRSDIATNASTAPQKSPNPRDYFDGNLDDFTRQYFDGSDEFNRRLDDYFYMGE